MTRALSGAMLADISAVSAEIVKFVELTFSGGIIRVTTAAFDITWNGMTFEGIGGAFDVEGFGESTDSSTNGNRLRLNGVDQTILAAILNENYRGQPARVWYVHLDKTTGTVVDAQLMFNGYVNEGFNVTESRSFQGGTVDISTKLILKINDFMKICGIRTQMHSHQGNAIGHFYTTEILTDTFFSLVPTIVAKRVRWGSKEAHQGVANPPTPPVQTGGSMGGGTIGGTTPGSSTPGIGNGPAPQVGVGGSTPGGSGGIGGNPTGNSGPGIGGGMPGSSQTGSATPPPSGPSMDPGHL